MTDARHGYAWAMAAVFVVALAVRVGATAMFVGFSSPPSASANPDQLDYEAFAWRLAQGLGYTLDDGTPTARRPPGTSATIAPVYVLFGRSFTAARLWMCVLSAATCVACGTLASLVLGRRVGVVAAIGLALYPGHFYYAMHMLSETPYALALTLATLATLVSVRRGSVSWAVAAGVLWAATLLVRPQVLLLPLLAAPLLVFGQRQVRIAVAASCLVCAFALSPWVIRNAMVMQRPALTTGFGHVMWGAHNDVTFTDPAKMGTWIATSTLLKDAPFHGGEAALDQHAMRQAKLAIGEHASSLPRLTLMKLVRLVEPVHDTPNTVTRLAFTVGWGVVAMLLLPGVALAWRRDRAGAIVLLLPMAATVMMTLLTYGLDRFRDSAAPLFVPLAAAAVVRAGEAVGSLWRRGRHTATASSLRCWARNSPV